MGLWAAWREEKERQRGKLVSIHKSSAVSISGGRVVNKLKLEGNFSAEAEYLSKGVTTIIMYIDNRLALSPPSAKHFSKHPTNKPTSYIIS